MIFKISLGISPYWWFWLYSIKYNALMTILQTPREHLLLNYSMFSAVTSFVYLYSLGLSFTHAWMMEEALTRPQDIARCLKYLEVSIHSQCTDLSHFIHSFINWLHLQQNVSHSINKEMSNETETRLSENVVGSEIITPKMVSKPSLRPRLI